MRYSLEGRQKDSRLPMRRGAGEQRQDWAGQVPAPQTEVCYARHTQKSPSADLQKPGPLN